MDWQVVWRSVRRVDFRLSHKIISPIEPAISTLDGLWIQILTTNILHWNIGRDSSNILGTIYLCWYIHRTVVLVWSIPRRNIGRKRSAKVIRGNVKLRWTIGFVLMI